MSLPDDTMLTLQAYADGELEGPELEAAESLLRENDEARAFVESIGILGHGIDAAYALEPLPLVDLTDAILRKVEAAERETEPDVGRDISVSRPGVPVPGVPRKSSEVTSLALAREKRAQRSQIALVVGALAMAAAGIVYFRGQHESQKPEVASVAAESTSPGAAASAGERGVEVHDIDSSEKNQVSVFYLPASGGNAASSVVVWIDDKGAP